MQASINQAPDYLYVTDVQSRFVEAARSTLHTTLREIFSSRQIALIGLPSTKCARRILAIVSTTSIPKPAPDELGEHCEPQSIRGSLLDAYNPENGGLIPRLIIV